jgi:RNA polymerase sigma factor (sigma-70 family)
MLPQPTPPEEEVAAHYRRFRNEFVAWAGKHFSAGAEDAKDMFQEALLVFYEQRRSGQLDGFNGNIKTYLFAIGKNLLLTGLRRSRIAGNHSDRYAIHVQGHHTPDALERMERDEDLSKVREHLEKLSAADKRVLELYYVERMDMKTIAETMGYASANVAKKKKCIALKRLMEKVKGGLMMFLL